MSDRSITEEWTGPENIIQRSLDVLRKICSNYDLCIDATGSKTILSANPIREAYLDLSRRGVKIRIITEVTKDNLAETKRTMEFAEVRHMHDMHGNFVIADKTDYAGSPETESSILTKLIVSNVSSFVKQQQYFFEMLWDKAIPAEIRIRELEEGIAFSGRTEILYGVESAVAQGVRFMKNVKNRMDIYFDSRAPSIVIEVEAYRNGYVDIRTRGGKIRAFTEITSDNLTYCKELMKLVDELRHLDGIKGGLAVSETEFMATTILEEAKPLTEVIYSNAVGVVQQGMYIFDTLWNKAIPAVERIAELEKGKEPQRTEVWRDQDIIVSRSLEILNKLERTYDFCIDWKGPSIIMTFEFIRKAYLDIISRGGKLRLITEIVPENLSFCKEITRFAEVRHLDKIKGNFGIVDGKIYGGTSSTDEKEQPPSYLYSTVIEFVRQQQEFFEMLWEKAVDAEERIKKLEEGVEPAIVELIRDPQKSISKAFEIMDNTRHELLVLFATPHTFVLAIQMGAANLYKKVCESGAKVRILVPKSDDESVIKELTKIRDTPSLEIRLSEKGLNTRLTILISDKKYFMSWELKDEVSQDPYQAAGIATYSNMESLATSYATIFDNLWMVTDFSENLRTANLRLLDNDKAMKEFLDIAAHELRTPIQPILGLSEFLQRKSKEMGNDDPRSGRVDHETRTFLEVIERNAKRLDSLAQDILDVTRIESGRLSLKKEIFDLDEVIRSIMQDTKQSLLTGKELSSGNNLSLSYNNRTGRDERTHNRKQIPLMIYGDRTRLGQVISNLVSNAVKFTYSGSIVVTADLASDHNSTTAVISITDTGSGIDKAVIPRLFEKFVSTSPKGIGLGLYICKNIVTAHGGRIWAHNNADGRGCTFSFTIPLNDNIPV